MEKELYNAEVSRIAKLVDEQIEEVILGRFTQGYEKFLRYSSTLEDLMDDIQRDYSLSSGERESLKKLMCQNGEQYFGLEITTRSFDECFIGVEDALKHNLNITNIESISEDNFQEYIESEEQHIIHSATSYLFRRGEFDEYVWMKITEEELEEIISEELQ